MKISTLEGVILTVLSVIFDIINILLAATLVLNTIVNVIFGGIFMMWFMLKQHLTYNSDEEEIEEENPYSEEYSDRIKKLLNSRREQEIIGEEINPQKGITLTEKTVGKTTIQRGIDATKKTGAQVVEKASAQATEKMAIQTTEKVTSRLLGRIIGVTLFSKIIPFINDIIGLLPLWTISTVLLWKQSIKEQRELKNAEFST